MMKCELLTMNIPTNSVQNTV